MPEDSDKLVWLGVLVLALGVLGIGIILALLSSWRNQARREKLLKQGRALRASQPHNRRRQAEAQATSDAWTEAGRRHRDEAASEGPDQGPDEGEDEADEPSQR